MTMRYFETHFLEEAEEFLSKLKIIQFAKKSTTMKFFLQTLAVMDF
jgi:hypothetical protein